MSAFGGMEQSESLISTKGGMCHEYKSNIPLFSRVLQEEREDKKNEYDCFNG